jgi:peptidoglycan-N-acetylglucosamine deacetylase
MAHMHSPRFLAGLACRVATCVAALGTGFAAARYTDIARVDRTVEALARRVAGPSVARAASVEAVRARPTDEGALGADAPTDEAAVREVLGGDDELTVSLGLAPALRDGMIMTGSTPHRLILFSFDDGPDRYTTPKLLDRLDQAGVRALFFLTGANLRGENAAERKNQQIARETVRRGHTVGSHGMNHRQLPLLSDFDVLSEVRQTEQVFERVLGGRPYLIRPPGGAHSPRIDRLLAERGYTTVLWNLGSGDFQVRTAEDVYKTWRAVFERRKSLGERGGIILLHDTNSWSVEAFSLIVQELERENCALLGTHEELYDFVDDPALFHTPRADASPSAEAPPVVLPPEVLALRQARVRAAAERRCAPAR